MGRERLQDHVLEDVAITLSNEDVEATVFSDGSFTLIETLGDVLDITHHTSGKSQEDMVIWFLSLGLEITSEVGQPAQRTHITNVEWNERLGLMTHRKGW